MGKEVKIVLTQEQEVVYRKVVDEILKERVEDIDNHDIFYDAEEVLVAAQLPVKAVWRGHKRIRRCRVTGKRIRRGDSCVIIFSQPVAMYDERPKRTVLDVLVDEVALFHLLDDLGSLTSLREERRLKSEQKQRKRRPIQPRQNVCYCVQCGIRIVRPEDMSLELFAKVFRCANCKEAGIPMPLPVERYCRTCGLPFIPTEVTHRVCTNCRKKDPDTK